MHLLSNTRVKAVGGDENVPSFATVSLKEGRHGPVARRVDSELMSATDGGAIDKLPKASVKMLPADANARRTELFPEKLQRIRAQGSKSNVSHFVAFQNRSIVQ
jgi:hypothetical protein